MIKDLRIVFMGTPDFAVGTLKALIENNYNIAGVVTAPDKPAGRGRKLNSSAVKKYAIEQGLPVLQPSSLKAPEFVEALKALQGNLQIVVAFRMLPKVVWDLPEYGTFNLHASLLPQYRGAAPIHWAIINGETQTGVTTFFIDDKIDTGAILLQEQTVIGPNDTLEVLYTKLMKQGSALVITTTEAIKSGTITPQPQTRNTALKTAYKLNKDNCKIDWSQEATSIYNKIRGLNPFPAAWTNLHNGEQKTTAKIFDCELELTEHNEPTGKIKQTKTQLWVYVKKGIIKVNVIQLENKKRLTVKALSNGYQFHNNSIMV